MPSKAARLNERAYSRRYRAAHPLACKAHAKVQNAIERGALQRATDLVCVDCGLPGQAWDHRDYTKPLEVEVVCGGCNKRRGPGYPYQAKSEVTWEGIYGR